MNAREIALGVVRDVFPPPESRAPERGAQEALEYRLQRSGASPRDRAFATELAYGAIKMRRTLDWYLAPFVAERREPLPLTIREILRLAVYELVFTQPDEHATVFEFVNLAKKYGHRGLANLVNAVLRRFLRERPASPQRDAFPSDEEYLGTRYSYPGWLVRQWIGTFGDDAEAICDACNQPARPAIVVNRTRGGVDECAQELSVSGITAQRSAIVEEVLLIESGAAQLARQDGNGRWWHQSESSAMPVGALNPQPGEAIADICSGRGNKALQIAARMEGEGTLLCVDRDGRKSSVLGRRFEQAGLVAGVLTGDATEPLFEPDQRFDRVLIDAPCSGTGVVGRHPEARWKKQGTDGERLAITQRALLERLACHVHPGGSLVYAVCSTDPRETAEVVDAFVARENFARGLIPAAYAPFVTEDGDVLIPPGFEGRDGFYIARLERGT